MNSTRIRPATVIIGSTPQRDRQGQPVMGLVPPLKKADGRFLGTTVLLAQPLFNRPKEIGFISHFVNAAAKRRCGGDMTQAKPSELVQVPVYRGTSARFMNEIKADNRRKRRQMSLVQKLRADIASKFSMKKTEAVSA